MPKEVSLKLNFEQEQIAHEDASALKPKHSAYNIARTNASMINFLRADIEDFGYLNNSNVSDQELIQGIVLDESQTTERRPLQVDWNECNRQFGTRQVYDYSDFIWKLDDLMFDSKLIDDYEHPYVTMFNYNDIYLDESESKGILSFRLLATSLSYLDTVPVLKKRICVPSKLMMPSRNLRDITIISRLTYIRHINFAFNHLTDVSCLSHCPFLVHLNVSYNELTTLLDFKPPMYLTYVDYSYNLLTKIPDLSDFWSLLHLNLSGNDIKVMEGLQNLKYLRFLNLSHNSIREIDNINNLRIEALNLVRNQIDGWANYNSYTEAKCGFKTMFHLKNVNLSDNNLSRLDFFRKSVKLRMVDLRNNNIYDLYELNHLWSATDLFDLNLRDNPIASYTGFRELCIFSVPSMMYLNNVVVDPYEKVASNIIFAPHINNMAMGINTRMSLIEQLNAPNIELSTIPFDSAAVPIIFLAGPIGSSKTKLIKDFIRKYPKHAYAGKLFTTCPPIRECRAEDERYHINRQEFDDKLNAGEFVYKMDYLGYSQAFPKSELFKAMEQNKVLLLCGDFATALFVRMRGLSPILIKAMPSSAATHSIWLKSKFEGKFWDIIRPRKTAVVVTRVGSVLVNDSDDFKRQTGDIYRRFSKNLIEIDQQEKCCECTCDCFKHFKHFKDWEKFVADLSKQFSSAESTDSDFEDHYEPSVEVPTDLAATALDQWIDIFLRQRLTYDDLYDANPGLFTDSINTDESDSALKKINMYVKKALKDYPNKQPVYEVDYDDTFVNMTKSRLNYVLNELKMTESTAAMQRREFVQSKDPEDQLEYEPKISAQQLIDKLTEERTTVDSLPENKCPPHLLYSTFRAFYE